MFEFRLAAPRVCLALAVLAAVPVPTAWPLQAAPLQPHRAVYDIRLDGSRSGSGIEAVEGRLAMDLTETCDGFIYNQRYVIRLAAGEGDSFLSEFVASTFESRDGNRFRFSYRQSVNGKLEEEVSGRATLGQGEAAGEALFDKPEERRVTLPAGTVFPTAHSQIVLDAALAGKRTVTRMVFDGSEQDGLFDTFGVLAKRRGAGAAETVPALAPLAWWPVRLGFFFANQRGEEPEYEVGLRMFENGVTDSLTLDYGDYSLSGALSHLEYFPYPDC